MRLRIINKIWITSIIYLVILLISASSIFAEEIYVPEPIVFIHGLNSDAETWDSTKNALKQYFVDEQTGSPKYEYKIIGEKGYYPYCDYRTMNTGDIPTIARGALIRGIYSGLESIPNDCAHKKVNIVAHSMGGLVTRSLLKQRTDLQNSINKIIFIGTPHKGSPYASALWLLNKIKEETLPALIKRNSNYFSKPTFSPFNFLSSDRLPYFSLTSKLTARYNTIASGLFLAKKGGIDPNSAAIDELRLDGDISYYNIVTGIASGFKVKSAEIAASYPGSEVFLSEINDNLNIPFNYDTIVGRNTSSDARFWALKEILEFGDAFTFPPGESLEDVYINGGDGIVSLASQEKLGNVHAVLIGVNHLEETQQAQAILDALDPSPVIENMYVVSADRTANGPMYPIYIVVKVKDYLLADIEISSITVDGIPLDLSVTLSDFNDGEGHYKPYVKFGKDFLKERSDPSLLDKDDNVITLYPGEFYIRVDLEGNEQHTVAIEVKNPSDNPPAQRSLIIQRPIITDEQPTGILGEDVRQPTIQARIYSPSRIQIDLNSLEMKLDGVAVSHTFELVYPPPGGVPHIIISYTPLSDLDLGEHTVTVNGRDINGIPAEEKEWTFGILYLSPPTITNETPTGHIAERRPTISARIYSPDGVSINLSSLIMKLDGNTIFHSTSGSGSDITISYTPLSNLNPGEHTVTVNARDINGIPAEEKEWTFTVGNLVNWEETWEGLSTPVNIHENAYAHPDNTVESYSSRDFFPSLIVADNVWANFYIGCSAICYKWYSGWSSGSARYNLDYSISSDGINWEAEVRVEADKGQVRALVTGPSLCLSHDFSAPYVYITKDSKIIIEGNGELDVEVRISGFPYRTFTSAGVHSLEEYNGARLTNIFLHHPYISANVTISEGGSAEDSDSSKVSYGNIKITSLLQ